MEKKAVSNYLSLCGITDRKLITRSQEQYTNQILEVVITAIRVEKDHPEERELNGAGSPN